MSAKAMLVILFVFIMAGCSLREINLSGYKAPSSDRVAYLFVNKTEFSPNFLIFVKSINGIELDLTVDPCVYIIKSGISKIAYSTSSDLRPDGTYTRHTLSATTEDGRYYQLLSNQGDSDDLRLTEIDKGKIEEVYDKQPSLLEMIFLFKG